jgi:hypothetical protein
LRDRGGVLRMAKNGCQRAHSDGLSGRSEGDPHAPPTAPIALEAAEVQSVQFSRFARELGHEVINDTANVGGQASEAFEDRDVLLTDNFIESYLDGKLAVHGHIRIRDTKRRVGNFNPSDLGIVFKSDVRLKVPFKLIPRLASVTQ